MVPFPMFRRETGNRANFPPLNKKIAVFPISVFPLSPGGEKSQIEWTGGGEEEEEREIAFGCCWNMAEADNWYLREEEKQN